MSRKILSLAVSFCFLFTQTGLAQAAAVELNLSGYFSRMSSNLTPIDTFRPIHLRYFSYDSLNNNFKVLLDKGDPKDLNNAQIQDEAKSLLKYFLIGVTLNDDKFWVNLRPDSPDQIIDSLLEETDIGKIMLEADLRLKKDTASFTSPQTVEGKEYWNKLYKKAEELYGTDTVTIPTLTRPWIVPNEIIVRETEDSAYIYKATLKVMLEQDYLRVGQNSSKEIQNLTQYEFKDERSKALNEYSTQLIRELIIPKLTKEVNNAKRYAPLRQVFYSLIMARWFKSRFAGKQGTYPALIDKQDLNNLTSEESWTKDTYFQAYKKSFAEGEYNIKEPVYTPTGQVIRSYFSGGLALNRPMIADEGTAASPLGIFSGLRDITKKIVPNLISISGTNLGSLIFGKKDQAPTVLDEEILQNNQRFAFLKNLSRYYQNLWNVWSTDAQESSIQYRKAFRDLWLSKIANADTEDKFVSEVIPALVDYVYDYYPSEKDFIIFLTLGQLLDAYREAALSTYHNLKYAVNNAMPINELVAKTIVLRLKRYYQENNTIKLSTTADISLVSPWLGIVKALDFVARRFDSLADFIDFVENKTGDAEIKAAVSELRNGFWDGTRRYHNELGYIILGRFADKARMEDLSGQYARDIKDTLSSSPAATSSSIQVKEISSSESQTVLRKTEIHGDEFNGIKLTAEILRRNNLYPRYMIETEGVKIYFSQLYRMSSRLAVVVYVDTGNGIVVARTYYQSSSQAMWRYLPGYLMRDGSIGWYDKGHSEDSLNAPYIIQMALSTLSRGQILEVDNPSLIFAGTARDIYTQEERTYVGEIEKEPTKLKGNFYAGEDMKNNPNQVVFYDKADEPDYNNLLVSFTMPSKAYGEITVEVYASKNRKYKFMLCKDSKDRVWIGGVENGSNITSMGIRENWVYGGDLSTPAFEYYSQDFGYGNDELRQGRYVDMFKNYISKIPIIAEYVSKQQNAASNKNQADLRQTIPQKETLGGNRALSRPLVKPFVGTIWIKAGAFTYKAWMDNGLMRFQRYDKKNGQALGAMRTFEMNESYIVGRSQNCNYSIPDNTLSSRHFSFKAIINTSRQAMFELIDLQSLNGTHIEWHEPQKQITPSLVKSTQQKDSFYLDTPEISNFDMLYERIKQLGGIQGSASFYPADDLIERINTVRQHPDTINIVTRTAGLRDKVKKLLTSSPMNTSSEDMPNRPGGIDFRRQAMANSTVYEPMGSFKGLNFTLPTLSKAELDSFDTAQDLRSLKNMIAANMRISGDRFKRLVAACVQKGEIAVRLDDLIACAVDMCQVEEMAFCLEESSPELREALVMLESDQFS